MDFYVAMIIFTIMILVADFVMNKYFVNRFGGSKIGEYSAHRCGCRLFRFPPFGIIIIPFVAVFIVELVQGFNFQAIKGEFWLSDCIFSEYNCSRSNNDCNGYLVLLDVFLIN